uniref:hypothetical protein n=1 Tax=Bartonella henselae TaxID=38323 RepID=UPI00249E7C16
KRCRKEAISQGTKSPKSLHKVRRDPKARKHPKKFHLQDLSFLIQRNFLEDFFLADNRNLSANFIGVYFLKVFQTKFEKTFF